ncbi:hypothetical protein SERLA73DRAFT_91572 [Serpula lacrymans var. lacrymans S7.3]|uniref:Cytochrome P450 n=2 Tax=Serpula lacrymans var. lacrymans TaxID=341189 RepID=F8PZH0_SERL3|nr:uncharacterized protein SERLADRAFT_416169 [Serpula lacrymans var. lacrymans S7.9]EGN98292.1 hypothetical protein SERLA73DRAFT_91572 [Serpula lacrymans var. lacrymans S7.3]EGO23862.1 hypothetical protein SERLADRAFT_416169 [Serpula lacrymans var. lacrymans S7.9]
MAKMPMPPGPRPWPIVGNMFSISPNEPWVTYMQWGKIYGDLVHCRVLTRDIIILNSERLTKALLERRSYNYSDRPQHISNHLFGWGFNSLFLAYGDEWRLHRRLFHQAFRAEASLTYRPMQLSKVHQMLLNLFETPEDYSEHMQTCSTAIIMAATYGYDPSPRHDPLVTIVERSVDMIVKALRPEVASILDALPFLRHLPSWFPGAGFQRDAIECRKVTAEMVELPFKYTKSSLTAGTAAPSMVSDILSREKEDDSHELALKHASATAYGAASESSASTFQVFVLAMFEHPEIQRKAQEEIDLVVGRDRLPDFSDRPSLPYVEALVRETLRWFPVVPLGLPHATTESDIFEGYYIPKGALVIANIWAITHNEDKYPNPSEFRPERFFLPDGKLNDDTMGVIFGFGRRNCVGRYVADASIWAGIVSMLAVFSIRKAKDELGRDIEVEPEWSTGLAIRPRPFKCCIEPRYPELDSERLTQMIQTFC